MGNRAGWLQNSESLLIDRSAARFHENQNVPNLILGSSSQSFAEHDLNMHLDRGFCAVFACWLHVCSAAEFWISIAWEIEPAGCRIQKVCCSIDQQLDFLNTRMDFGSSSQNVAKHDLNMQLDPGFRAVFACWMHVFSEAEFRISVHEKSSLLAAEFEKVC